MGVTPSLATKHRLTSGKGSKAIRVYDMRGRGEGERSEGGINEVIVGTYSGSNFHRKDILDIQTHSHSTALGL